MARVIAATGALALQPALRAAFQKENDAVAAGEEASALLAVSPSANDSDLLAAARPPFAATVALVLAQVRGPAARSHLGRVASLGLDTHQARQFFVQATRGGRVEAAEMARAAVGTGDPGLVEGFFAAGRAGGFPVAADALEAALSSADRRLNAAACWHLALSKVAGTRVPEALGMAAQRAAQAAAPSAADAGAAFACDVLSRTLGGRAAEQGPWVEQLAAADGIALPPDLIDDGRILGKLSDAELRALAIRMTGSPDGLAEAKRARGRRLTASTAGPGRGMRLAAGFTPGLLADTLRVAGCTPANGAFAGGEIVYLEDGRPREVRMLNTGLTPACHAASGTLLALARPAAQRPPDPGSPQVLLLNLDPMPSPAQTSRLPSARPGRREPEPTSRNLARSGTSTRSIRPMRRRRT